MSNIPERNGLKEVLPLTLNLPVSKDPWHVGTASIGAVGGVNSSVTRVLTKGGAHHQDLRFSSRFDSDDVHKARAYELATIRSWLSDLK